MISVGKYNDHRTMYTIYWKILWKVMEYFYNSYLYTYCISVVVDSDFGEHTKALIVEVGQPHRGSGCRDWIFCKLVKFLLKYIFNY